MSVNIERDGAVCIITIARPEKLNALDPPARTQLLAALESGADARAVVLTGQGRGFCVGHDLGADDDPDIHAVVRDTYNPIARAIVDLDLPVIAAINGAAVGAGMGFALACDLRVMADSAYLSCAFGKVGLVPDSGVSSTLVRAVGHARAFEMAVSGRRIGAEEALALGLVNRVVAVDRVRGEAIEWAREIAAGPALALALTKRLLVAGGEKDLDTILDREALSQGIASRGGDFAEGKAAVFGKRAPLFGSEPAVVPEDVPRRR